MDVLRTLVTHGTRPLPGGLVRAIGGRRLLVLLTLLLAYSGSGCGYMVGNSYQQTVQTVTVPTFTSEDYRRGYEMQLTEAVQKQIQQRTHFRLVKDGNADTRLTGKIKRIRKNVLGETAQDDPRELQLHMTVDVTWEDLRTGKILAQESVAIDPNVLHLVSTGDMAPEIGQSLATGTQVEMDRMARQIVDLMQTPW